jgi:8-oxo-dGTP pyrophosphatase MutT (NUDIX family)
VLVLDATQRVLLFKVHDALAIDTARPTLTTWWGSPGGGVEHAESFEEAGMRELWEETGLRVRQLGPWVATYERTIRFPDEVVLFHIRYFVVEAPSTAVDVSNLLDDEQAIYRDHRWWSIAEMTHSDEAFLPPSLPDLLRILLAGERPLGPIVLR